MKYKISLSNKESVLTDEEGYKKLLDNISSNFVIIGDEVINPSFISSITKINDYLFDNYIYDRTPKRKLVGHIDDTTRTYVIDKIEEE